MRHGLLVLVLLLGVASRASAEPTAQELITARALFEEGTELEKKKDYAGALEKFRKVATIKATSIVRYHEGYCAEKVGKWVEALDAYTRAMAAGQDDPKQKQAHDAAKKAGTALRPRIPRLEVKVTMPRKQKYELRIDGRLIAEALLDTPIFVDPGKHVVEVSAEGLVGKPREVTLAEKELLEVTIDLEEPTKTAQDPPKKDPDPPKKDPPKQAPTPPPPVAASPPAALVPGRAVFVAIHLGNLSPGGRLFDAAGDHAPYFKRDDVTDQAQYVGFGFMGELDVGFRISPALGAYLFAQHGFLTASGVSKAAPSFGGSSQSFGAGAQLSSPTFAGRFAVVADLAVGYRLLRYDAGDEAAAIFRGFEPRARLGLSVRIAPTLTVLALGWLAVGSYNHVSLRDAAGSSEQDLTASAMHTFYGASIGVAWDAVVLRSVTPTWP